MRCVDDRRRLRNGFAFSGERTPKQGKVWLVESEHAVFTLAGAGRYLGVSTDTIYRYVEKGLLPVIRFGTRPRIPKQALDAYIGQESRKAIRAVRRRNRQPV
jgi:excisionase family DNA binding protein